MKYTYFIPQNDAEALSWLKNFSDKLGKYATKYGITPEQVADMLASYLFLAYWVDYKNQYAEYVKKVTSYKNELRNGNPNNPPLLPTAPTFAAPPAAVSPGIFVRAAAIATTIKGNIKYNETDGKDLGIISIANDLNLVDVIPIISIRLVGGGQPEIVWSKNGYQGITIEVDRGDGKGWVFLSIDTHPNYTDKFPLPVGKVENWKYRVIYLYNDEKVGNYSATISINVGA
jgi:hypothetical protein